MRIIEQSHEILHMDSLEHIEQAGRTCYKSEDKIGCTVEAWRDCQRKSPKDMVTPCVDTRCMWHSANKFVQGIIKRGHEAMIEHGSATVKFITNRGVTHELVRHRLCAFGQESTRYVNYGDKEMEFIRPVWIDPDYFDQFGREHDESLLHELADRVGSGEGWPMPLEMWTRACVNAEAEYNRLLNEGWHPEQAREVLPNALKTEIVVTANYREWRHIFKLRALGTTGKPHPQMQALMLPVLREFQERMPALFDGLSKE